MNSYLQNATSEMIPQTTMNQEILQCLDALEAVVSWLGEHQHTLLTLWVRTFSTFKVSYMNK